MPKQAKRVRREQRFEVRNPLVVMFRTPDGDVTTHLHPPDDITYEHYGMLVCDLVRHIARAYGVTEEDVWEWVDRERDHHTTEIEIPS